MDGGGWKTVGREEKAALLLTVNPPTSSDRVFVRRIARRRLVRRNAEERGQEAGLGLHAGDEVEVTPGLAGCEVGDDDAAGACVDGQQR